MQKTLLRTGSLLALGLGLFACFQLTQTAPTTTNPTDTSDGGGWLPSETKTDPGWYQQWFDLRKNEQGEIPRGLYSQWAQHDQQYSGSRSAALSGITEVGPYDVGGRTRALLIDASNSSRYFAGGISGGLWRSNNAGVTWTSLNDQSSNLAVSCITQDPFNSNVLYYGTGEGSGNSAGFPGEGVFKSTDGGNTFSLLASTNTGDFDYCWSIVHSRTNANTVFVGTSSRGLWRSTNAGTSWTKVLTTTRRINDMIALPNGTIMAALNGDGIWQSTNNGTTWTEIAGGLPTTGFARIAIDFCENSPDNIYALYAESNDVIKELYKSTDGGATWAATSAKPATTLKFTWYCFFLGVSPTNPDHVVLGAQFARYSLNGGSSWSTLSTGHADNHSYAFDPTNTDQFLLGNDGGVYRKTWSSITSTPIDLNDGYHVTQFYSGDYMPSGNSVLAGTQDNGTHKAIGLNWTKVLGGDGGYAQVSLQDPNLGYCSTQNGLIRRVNNLQGSSSTTSIYSTITSADNTLFIAPFEINRNDGEQVYFCSTTRIWRTTDRGASWTALTNAHGTIYGVGVTKAVNPTVYFGGSSAKIYRIDNAQTAAVGSEADLSATVPSAVTNHTISDIKPHPTDNSKVYVTFSTISSQPRVWRVDNANTATPTWVAISGNLPASLPCNSMEVDPTNDQNIFVGTDFGLYCSTDGGTNYAKETGVPNTSVFQVQLRASDNKLFVFTHGRGAWSANVGSGGGLNYAALPYSTGFEGGLDTYWSTTSDNANGRVQVTTANTPQEGSEHLTMDVITNGTYATNNADLRLDLSGQSDVELRFWWKEFADETNTQDGVFFSSDGGNNFTKVSNLQNGTSTYAEQVLDVDALATANGISLSSTFVIRFQQYDNYAIATDGFAFDNIQVTGGASSDYASVPYSTGFESGLDQYWTTASDNNNGRVQITTANGPHAGTNHLTMDVITNGTYATNQADLRVNLAGEIGINLRFWWKEFSDENNTQDGIYFSDNGGTNFTKVFDLTNGPSTYTEQVLDVVNLATTNGLSMTGNFVIRFQQYDNYAITTDGFAFDDVAVEVTADPFLEQGPNIGEVEENGASILPEEAQVADWSVTAFPNPANDFVILKVTGELLTNDLATVRLLDPSGREVFRQNNVVLAAGQNHQIGLSELPAGLYLVMIDAGEQHQVLRVLKQ